MTDSRLPAPVPPALADDASAPWLEIDRLRCYQVALEFLALVPQLLPTAPCLTARALLIRVVQMLSKLMARHTA